MSKILLTGTMRCEPDEVDEVLSLIEPHIGLTRDEPGCLSFELWQDELDPCNFHMSEVFRSEDAFTKHQDRTHSSHWGRLTRHMQRDINKSDA